MADYKVKSGDTAWAIAKAHGLTLQQLKSLNPGRQNWDLIYPGEVFAVSSDAGSSTESQDSSPTTKTTSSSTQSTSQTTAYSDLVTFKNRGYDILPIEFVDDATDTLWVYDVDNNIFREFQSPEAVATYFGKPLNDVMKNINSLSVQATENDFFKNAKWIGGEKYMVNSSGKSQEEPVILSGVTGLKEIYGINEKDPVAEEYAANILNFSMTEMLNNGSINQATFDNVLKDTTQFAKYLNAITYGGYTIGDVYRDVKAKELAQNGQTEYANIKAIDELQPAESWYYTDEGEKAKNSVALNPSTNLDMDYSILNKTVFQIPDEAFKSAIDIPEFGTPEFKAAAEQIEAAYYDTLMMQATADTEQGQALAQDNWNNFVRDIERTYGIRLSNDARAAWGQIQQLKTGAASSGLAGSGIYNEMVDNYLADVRRSNDYLREQKLNDEETAMRDKLLKVATAKEIKEFVNANPDKAQAWGLIPSQDILEKFSLENLKAENPTLSEAEIKLMRDTILDENGNYRSNLYQTMYRNQSGITSKKQSYQQAQLLNKLADDERKAMESFTKSSGLSGYVPEGASYQDYFTDKDAQTTKVADNIDYGQAPEKTSTTATQKAAQAISKNLSGGSSSSPTTTKFNPSTGLLEKVSNPNYSGSSSGSYVKKTNPTTGKLELVWDDKATPSSSTTQKTTTRFNPTTGKLEKVPI